MDDTVNRDPPWLEALIALSLSVAGLTTTWSSYQSALWDGEQAANYSRANAQRIEAARASARADQEAAVDVQLFSAWLDATAAGEGELSAFYHARFRPEFRPAFDAWLDQHPLKNPAAPPTPFATRAYHLAARVHAAELEKTAQTTFDKGQRDNETSDVYVQATVILASAMFFGGICQTFKRPRVRIVLAVLSMAACAAGLLRTLTLPALPLPII